jgi:hypothetical protein
MSGQIEIKNQISSLMAAARARAVEREQVRCADLQKRFMELHGKLPLINAMILTTRNTEDFAGLLGELATNLRDTSKVAASWSQCMEKIMRLEKAGN